MELTVTGCLKIEAVCLMGGTKFASFLKLFVKSYCLLLLAAWPFDFDFAPPPLEEDFPFVVAKAENKNKINLVIVLSYCEEIFFFIVKFFSITRTFFSHSGSEQFW